MQWMIYGANGYTGELIAREANRRGLTPILAGRNQRAVAALAEEMRCEQRIFALEDPPAVHVGLAGIGLVLHCAGPFSATSAPMLEACINERVHYLDITGEIDVFAHAQAQDARCQRAGIIALPGVGFDVVPTDCLAAILKRKMPAARALMLAFDAEGGASPGTAKSGIEGLGGGGRVRVNGELKRVPLAWKVRFFERDGEQRIGTTIPWGDVFTAFVSTGIADIEVYMTMPPKRIQQIRRWRWLGPLLGAAPVQRFLKHQIERRVRGPSDEKRERSGSMIWGEVRDANGVELRHRLRTPNGYALTVTAALGIVQHLLEHKPERSGFYTPSMLMGADYVLSLPGVRLE